jgi:cyanophycinase-like exopeptidase
MKRKRKTTGKATSGVKAGGTSMPNKMIPAKESRKMKDGRKNSYIPSTLRNLFKVEYPTEQLIQTLTPAHSKCQDRG